MNTPLLSICIPTFNRATLLSETLDSILKQLSKSTAKQIEIVISNNNSEDNTEKVVREYQKKFPFITYHRNKTNTGNKNTITVATYAQGKYIWFLSDDDQLTENALNTVLEILEEAEPDAVYGNLYLVDKDGKTVLEKNVLRTNAVWAQTRKELFNYLDTTFFLPIDWLITCYSITILKRSLFQKYLPDLKNYSSSEDIFPHTSFVYYHTDDLKVVVTSEELIYFRVGNRSFGPTKKVEFLLFWYPVLNRHYARILQINRKYTSLKFRTCMFLKQISRDFRIAFLKCFGVDISDVLIALFERK